MHQCKLHDLHKNKTNGQLIGYQFRQEISIGIAIFCRERGIRVVSEAWLVDSIQKKEAQPLEAYDIVSDLSVGGKGIPWDKQDPSEEALESLSAEVYIHLYVLASLLFSAEVYNQMEQDFLCF